MLSKINKNIKKNKIQRIKLLKSEFLKLVLKSIIHNKTLKNKERAFIKVYSAVRCSPANTTKNICLLTSNYKGNYKYLNIARRSINRFCKDNLLTNFKMNS